MTTNFMDSLNRILAGDGQEDPLDVPAGLPEEPAWWKQTGLSWAEMVAMINSPLTAGDGINAYVRLAQRFAPDQGAEAAAQQQAWENQFAREGRQFQREQYYSDTASRERQQAQAQANEQWQQRMTEAQFTYQKTRDKQAFDRAIKEADREYDLNVQQFGLQKQGQQFNQQMASRQQDFAEQPKSLKDLYMRDLLKGSKADLARAQAYYDLEREPTNAEKLNLAMQVARSPGDLLTLTMMQRGELPRQATPGKYERVVDNAPYMQDLANQTFRPFDWKRLATQQPQAQPQGQKQQKPFFDSAAVQQPDAAVQQPAPPPQGPSVFATPEDAEGQTFGPETVEGNPWEPRPGESDADYAARIDKMQQAQGSQPAAQPQAPFQTPAPQQPPTAGAGASVGTPGGALPNQTPRPSPAPVAPGGADISGARPGGGIPVQTPGSYINQKPKKKKYFAAGGIAGLNGPEEITVGDGGEPEVITPVSQFFSRAPQTTSPVMGPTSLPFSARQVGLQGGALERPKSLPSLGALSFRSRQAQKNMTPTETAFFNRAVEQQGVPLLDYLEAEEEETSIGAPRNRQAYFSARQAGYR